MSNIQKEINEHMSKLMQEQFNIPKKKFDAMDAYLLATSMEGTAAKNQLNEVLDKIRHEAEHGEIMMIYDDEILPQVKNELESRGFSIDYKFCRNESWYSIRWDAHKVC